MSAIAPEQRATPTPVPAGVAPRAHPCFVLALILGGGVAAIGLWWTNTTEMSGFGDWLTNGGRLAGLAAGYGVVVLVALMARIPPLERGVGADRLARWHSMGGRYIVSLIVVHAVLITWGYAVTAHTNVVHQTKSLLLSYPDVLMATVGGLLFVAVGVTSARAARKRMRYETWFYLHLYTYLAIALAFSHQFATGSEFMQNRLARIVWSALYAAVGIAIVWYRVLTPVYQARRHALRVERVTYEGPGVVSVTVTGKHLEELRAAPGQFFRWRFLTKNLWWTATPYSLSAPPEPNRLRITAKAFGEHSAALATLQRGTRVITEGPYGALTADHRRRRKTLLIAGGIGVTPLRALFATIPAGPGELALVYRARSEQDVVLRDELERIAARREARLWFLTGSLAELGHDPLSREALTQQFPDLAEHDVYICGPEGMAHGVARSLRAAGVPSRQVHVEAFAF